MRRRTMPTKRSSTTIAAHGWKNFPSDRPAMNSSREFFPSLRTDRRFVVRNRKVTTEVDGNRGTEGYDREGPFEAPEVRRVRTRRSEGSELRRSSSDEDLSRYDEGLRQNRACEGSDRGGANTWSSDEGPVCRNWTIFFRRPIPAHTKPLGAVRWRADNLWKPPRGISQKKIIEFKKELIP